MGLTLAASSSGRGTWIRQRARGIELSEKDDGLHMAFKLAKTAAATIS